MNRFRRARYLLCLAVVFGLLGSLGSNCIALANQESGASYISPSVAQEEPPPPEPVPEKLEVYSDYPIMQTTVGSSLEFEITLYYEGNAPKTFDLELTAPEGWSGKFTGGYPETEISAFTVEPAKKSELIYLTVEPLTTVVAQPGDYQFIVNAISDTISGSTELKAVIVSSPPEYLLYLYTSTLLSEFQIKPKQDNHISIELQNYQTGTVKDIVFTAEAPEGWQATFTPDKLASLEPGVTQEIDFVITPSPDTPAGDYPVIIKATGDKAEMERELRLTVTTTTAVGVVGIGIAIAVIVGLAIWFRKAGGR